MEFKFHPSELREKPAAYSLLTAWVFILMNKDRSELDSLHVSRSYRFFSENA